MLQKFFLFHFFNPVIFSEGRCRFFLKKIQVNPKIYYWGGGTNIFFLQYKDNIFFCCLQTFFITGVCKFKKMKKNLDVLILVQNRRKVKECYWVIKFVITGRLSQIYSWGNHPVINFLQPCNFFYFCPNYPSKQKQRSGKKSGFLPK